MIVEWAQGHPHEDQLQAILRLTRQIAEAVDLADAHSVRLASVMVGLLNRERVRLFHEPANGEMSEPLCRCLGFGEWKGMCTATVAPPSHHWCQRCERLRQAHISRQLDAACARLEARLHRQQEEVPR